MRQAVTRYLYPARLCLAAATSRASAVRETKLHRSIPRAQSSTREVQTALPGSSLTLTPKPHNHHFQSPRKLRSRLPSPRTSNSPYSSVPPVQISLSTWVCEHQSAIYHLHILTTLHPTYGPFTKLAAAASRVETPDCTQSTRSTLLSEFSARPCAIEFPTQLPRCHPSTHRLLNVNPYSVSLTTAGPRTTNNQINKVTRLTAVAPFVQVFPACLRAIIKTGR